jgi:diacylglycerol O-acyltransferase / wax synthase
MKRLSGTDALFLSMETPSWHQHVGGLTILEPGDRPVTFDDIVRLLEQRLPYAPKFRWKLKNMPLGLDVPIWVDDEDFDVRRHVRRLGVPSPGGFRETAEVAGMIMSSQLDRSRPLWECWFLDGLAGGRVALVMKYHHCLLDGVSGASLATVLMDITPDATEPLVPPPPLEQQQAGAQPGTLDTVTHVANQVARQPFRLPRYIYSGARKLSSGARELARTAEYRGGLRAPSTSFNKKIGPQRALSFASVALDDLKQLKVKHDVKINDVVLALVGGALRQYLKDKAEVPGGPLVAGVPVSTRPEGDTTQDNKVSAMFVSLATNVDEPVERLLAIHASSLGAKALRDAMSAHQIQSLGEVASPLILSTAIRALYQTQLAARGPTIVNTTVSNVPGPPIPLYVSGARVTGIYPCSIIIEGMGINCTVISYMDRIDFGFHVDPMLVPDPWLISQGIAPALAELKKASGLGPPAKIPDAFGERNAHSKKKAEQR